MKSCNENIMHVLDVVRDLLFLSDKGDLQREDDGCGVLYGIIRDSAYKIKAQAEKEILNHRNRGTWDGGEVNNNAFRVDMLK